MYSHYAVSSPRDERKTPITEKQDSDRSSPFLMDWCRYMHMLKDFGIAPHLLSEDEAGFMFRCSLISDELLQSNEGLIFDQFCEVFIRLSLSIYKNRIRGKNTREKVNLLLSFIEDRYTSMFGTQLQGDPDPISVNLISSQPLRNTATASSQNPHRFRFQRMSSTANLSDSASVSLSTVNSSGDQFSFYSAAEPCELPDNVYG